ncbi:hypothetical protein F5Y15DRAFT_120586 [Xylariaceae sp. FL0016]|nr:hypothetical protein F5Y15DRAFT_120586 [Xylariaceae sp. FL0016]
MRYQDLAGRVPEAVFQSLALKQESALGRDTRRSPGTHTFLSAKKAPTGWNGPEDDSTDEGATRRQSSPWYVSGEEYEDSSCGMTCSDEGGDSRGFTDMGNAAWTERQRVNDDRPQVDGWGVVTDIRSAIQEDLKGNPNHSPGPDEPISQDHQSPQDVHCNDYKHTRQKPEDSKWYVQTAAGSQKNTQGFPFNNEAAGAWGDVDGKYDVVGSWNDGSAQAESQSHPFDESTQLRNTNAILESKVERLENDVENLKSELDKQKGLTAKCDQQLDTLLLDKKFALEEKQKQMNEIEQLKNEISRLKALSRARDRSGI